MAPRSKLVRKALVTGALVTGVSFGAAGIASAASSSSSTSSSNASNTKAPALGAYGSAPSGTTGKPPAGAGDPASLTHGPGETLLTGDSLQKAVAAAKAAVPGATVVRAETDSSGASTYEVHMKKADGSYVTVELNSNFVAVKTISGFGAGPAGGQAPAGAGGQGGPGGPPATKAA